MADAQIGTLDPEKPAIHQKIASFNRNKLNVIKLLSPNKLNPIIYLN